jgi:hypothetical protein
MESVSFKDWSRLGGDRAILRYGVADVIGSHGQATPFIHGMAVDYLCVKS